MIVHILFQRFVAQDKAESSGRIDVDGLLQIQLLKRNRVLHGLLATLLDELEVQFAICDPVVSYVQNCAVGQKQLWHVFSFIAVHVYGNFEGRRNDVDGTRGRDRGITRKEWPEEIAILPRGAEIVWPKLIAKYKAWTVDEDQRRVWPNGPNRPHGRKNNTGADSNRNSCGRGQNRHMICDIPSELREPKPGCR